MASSRYVVLYRSRSAVLGEHLPSLVHSSLIIFIRAGSGAGVGVGIGVGVGAVSVCSSFSRFIASMVALCSAAASSLFVFTLSMCACVVAFFVCCRSVLCCSLDISLLSSCACRAFSAIACSVFRSKVSVRCFIASPSP